MRFVQPRQHALLGYSPLVAAQMHRVDEVIGRWMRRTFDKAIAAAHPSPDLLASLRGRRVRSAVKMYEMAIRELPPADPATPGFGEFSGLQSSTAVLPPAAFTSSHPHEEKKTQKANRNQRAGPEEEGCREKEARR